MKSNQLFTRHFTQKARLHGAINIRGTLEPRFMTRLLTHLEYHPETITVREFKPREKTKKKQKKKQLCNE